MLPSIEIEDAGHIAHEHPPQDAEKASRGTSRDSRGYPVGMRKDLEQTAYDTDGESISSSEPDENGLRPGDTSNTDGGRYHRKKGRRQLREILKGKWPEWRRPDLRRMSTEELWDYMEFMEADENRKDFKAAQTENKFRYHEAGKAGLIPENWPYRPPYYITPAGHHTKRTLQKETKRAYKEDARMEKRVVKAWTKAGKSAANMSKSPSVPSSRGTSITRSSKSVSPFGPPAKVHIPAVVPSTESTPLRSLRPTPRVRSTSSERQLRILPMATPRISPFTDEEEEVEEYDENTEPQ